MKRKLLLYIMLISFSAVFAQEQQLKRANKLFDEYAYVEAAEAYEEYLSNKKQPGTETIIKIADTYYNIQEYAKARQWYAKLYEILGQAMEEKYFNRYIQSLRINEDYKKADEAVKKHYSLNKPRLKEYFAQKKYVDSINSAEAEYRVTNLEINTDKADFGTAFYGNRIVYSSSKNVSAMGGKIYKWNEQPFLDLYVADRNAADGSFFNEEKFIPKDQNSYHNATLTFTPDLKTVYYSTNTVRRSGFLRNAKDGTNNLRIIKGTIGEGKLEDVQPLQISNTEYSIAHPALSADGKWLYFVSDMPGGYGETDIYVAQVLEDGQLAKVENLGPAINTAAREMFPFINGNILYFSSDGYYGMGGLDVFKSTISADRQYSAPVNLGMPVNSSHDDFAFIIDKDETYGYLSSNRKGGKGDDDIYYFTKKPEQCLNLLAGTVTHAKYKIPINQTTVKLYDEYGDVLATVITGENGKYDFGIALCETSFKIEASKAEHNTVAKEITTGNKNGEQVITDLELVNYDDVVRQEDGLVKIDINPIFFDLDKYDITPRAEEELNKVVYVMKNFPSMVIKIESHTDSRAPDDYNIILSENRAKATYNYIITQGIDPSRIESIHGYGETRLRNRCSNDVPCSEEEHQLNRRSDFIIVKR